MYRKLKVKSLSYGTWVQLMLISVLPFFGLVFLAWLVTDISNKQFLMTVCSMIMGCLISAIIAKFGMFLTCASLQLKVETDE